MQLTKNLLELTSVVLSVLIRSKVHDDSSDNYIDMINLMKSMGIDELEARNVGRKFDDIGDKIAISCKKVLDNTELEEDRKIVIVKMLKSAYENADISIVDFLQMHADTNKIRNKILKNSNEYFENCDKKEQELYERLVDHTAHLLVNAYIKLPEFTQEGIKRLNEKIDEICDKVNELIQQINRVEQTVTVRGDNSEKFEKYYRKNVLTQNSYVNLIGAGASLKEYKRYPLSISYVELEIADSISGKVTKINDVLKKTKNIWLSGDAGSGKTTLLQWIAMKSAENSDEISRLRNTIPIFIPLRKYNCAKLSLKQCIENIMKDSSYNIPEGWMEQLIQLGRFVFLIDGFDEVNENAREQTLVWLKQTDPDDKCVKIYTARPQVQERPQCMNLIEVMILPMNRFRIKQFINYWHKAVLEEQLRIDKEETCIIANQLYEKVIMNDPIMKLSTVPLLCAMICALHYRNEMNLPENRRELYEECCKMLIERRDKEKEIKYIDIRLSYEQKKIIFAKLAYWMMKNNYVQVSKSDAIKSVKSSLEGMGVFKGSQEANNIFKFLMERCGILREPEKDKIDFIHRTFQEYLTAYEMSREEDWGVVEEKIGNTIWQETIGLAIGYAKKEMASKLIRSTLCKASKGGNRYLFLAISYLNSAVEVDKKLRQSIEEIVDKLIPPALEECTQIAEAGDLAVQFLVNKSEYGIEERYACLYTLNLAGTIKALEISKTYFDAELSCKELEELGELYMQFSNKELVEHDIVGAIQTYIEKVCGTQIVLHGVMLNILNELEENGTKKYKKKKINDLKIIDFCEDISKIRYKGLCGVESLSVQGRFSGINILNCFTNIKRLRINNQDSVFSIYDLNLYSNLYNLEKFSLITESSEYINGKDLAFLSNCIDLEIILMNKKSEVSFEHFDLLHSLKKLTIGAEYVLDFDFSTLPDNIEVLVVAAPRDYSSYVSRMSCQEQTTRQILFKDLEDYDDEYLYNSSIEKWENTRNGI